MEYVIRKENNGYTVAKYKFNQGVPEVWAYSTLSEALDGLGLLFNPPVIVPAETVVIG